jgi:hypothetical protein
MDWQPQEAPLKELTQCLKDTLGADANARRKAEVVSTTRVPSPHTSALIGPRSTVAQPGQNRTGHR